MRNLRINVDPSFDLRVAACGHGWYDLLPFEFDKGTGKLGYAFVSSSGRPCAITVTQKQGHLLVKADDGEIAADEIRRTVRHILRLDDDLERFYSLTSKKKKMQWIRSIGAGRLLRSSTVFEDLVKTICTTNCTWALTKIMVTNLVEKLGGRSPSGKLAFPDAAAMAAVDETFFSAEIRAGYRAGYLAELAGKVRLGELDTEKWLASPLDTAALKKEMRSAKGVGNYAAEHMLKLLGRYDGLALDSWIRGEFYKLYRKGEKCEDAVILDHYKGFKEWKGLAVWCDVTQDWFAE